MYGISRTRVLGDLEFDELCWGDPHIARVQRKVIHGCSRAAMMCWLDQELLKVEMSTEVEGGREDDQMQVIGAEIKFSPGTNW